MIDVALGNLKLPALQRKRGIQAGGDEDIQPQIMHQIFYLMKKYDQNKINKCQSHVPMKNHQQMFQRVRNKYILILNIYLRPEQQDLLLEYDEDDCALDEEDRINEIIERSGNH